MPHGLVRLGGLAGVVAGAGYVAAWLIDLLFVARWEWPPFALVSFSEYLVELVFAVALLSTLVAIAGLHAAHRGHHGWAVAVGSSVAFLGHAIMLYATIETAFSGTSKGQPVFLLDTGLLVALIGMALLGLATLFARALPRWCGLALIVGYPLPVFFGIGYNAWAPYGWVGAILWAALGYVLLSRSGDAPARQPAHVN